MYKIFKHKRLSIEYSIITIIIIIIIIIITEDRCLLKWDRNS